MGKWDPGWKCRSYPIAPFGDFDPQAGNHWTTLQCQRGRHIYTGFGVFHGMPKGYILGWVEVEMGQGMKLAPATCKIQGKCWLWQVKSTVRYHWLSVYNSEVFYIDFRSGRQNNPVTCHSSRWGNAEMLLMFCHEEQYVSGFGRKHCRGPDQTSSVVPRADCKSLSEGHRRGGSWRIQ